MHTNGSIYQFGRFQLNESEHRLSHNGAEIHLTPKAFDTLLELVRHGGQVLTKDRLMALLWPDGFVAEVSLAANISGLRKRLSEKEPDAIYIETVPKVGYRFVGQVRRIDPDRAKPTEQFHAHQTNIPARLTQFIGRKRELSHTTQLLIEHRLVTLVGAAGMGKTRLAYEAGEIALAQFPAGVRLVELSLLSKGADIPQLVLASLGLSEKEALSSVDSISAYIGTAEMLLILDNCEHIAIACAELSNTLLRNCPQLHILATSREPLSIPGEAIMRVPPLSLPEVNEEPEPGHAIENDAIQLFVIHATLAKRDFSLNSSNLSSVISICRQLDGMPLAIEMAASHVGDMSLAQIRNELGNRFSLLDSDRRSAIPHHRSLRATLEWSYDLLTPREQTVLNRLSVFVGGWNINAADAVCSIDGLPVLPDLVRLVHKSLVISEDQPASGEMRFRLLESVREFALTKLRAAREEATVRDRHSTHYLTMVEALVDLAGPRFDTWLHEAQRERYNLRAAFDYAIQRNDKGECAARFAYGMSFYHVHIGRLTEFEGQVNAVLEKCAQGPAYARARAHHAKASVQYFKAKTAAGLMHDHLALKLYRQADDQLGLAWTLEALANNSFDDTSVANGEEALALFRKLGSQDGEGRALRALGAAAYRSNDVARAAQLLERAIEIAPWDSAAYIDLFNVNGNHALALCKAACARYVGSGESENAAWMLLTYGYMLLALGDYEAARGILEQSAREWLQAGSSLPLSANQLSELINSTSPASTLFAIAPDSNDFLATLLGLGFLEMALGNQETAYARLNQVRECARVVGVSSFEHYAGLLMTSQRASHDHSASVRKEIRGWLRHYAGAESSKFQAAAVAPLNLLAQMLAHDGQFLDAVTLFGAAESMTSQFHIFRTNQSWIIALWLRFAQQSFINSTLTRARQSLGADIYQHAMSEGRQMNLSQAVAFALAHEPCETC